MSEEKMPKGTCSCGTLLDLPEAVNGVLCECGAIYMIRYDWVFTSGTPDVMEVTKGTFVRREGRDERDE